MTGADGGADTDYAFAALKATLAQLVGEPFYLPMRDVALLTDRQIAEVYFHGRDQQGRIEAPEAPGGPTEAEVQAEFFRVCMELGTPLAEAGAMWEERQARRAADGHHGRR